MVAAKRKQVVFAVDLERPVRSEELIDGLANNATDISTVIVKTNKGPMLAFKFHERTFCYLSELIEYLKTVGLPDGAALEAT